MKTSTMYLEERACGFQILQNLGSGHRFPGVQFTSRFFQGCGHFDVNLAQEDIACKFRNEDVQGTMSPVKQVRSVSATKE